MLNEPKQKNLNPESISSSEVHNLSADAMAEIGLQTLVYVRPVRAREVAAEMGGQLSVSPDTWLYAVHAANGVRVAIVDSRAAAFEGARAYGYEPQSVH